MATMYFDIDVLDNDGRVNFENANLLKRHKEEGDIIAILFRGRDIKNVKKWLDEKGLSPFVDVLRQVKSGKTLYDSVEDRTGTLITKYESDIQEWFSDTIKCVKEKV